MLEVLNQDYIRTARAKGLTERRGHRAARAAQRADAAGVHRARSTSSRMIGGAVITETIFGWAGMGRLFVDLAAEQRGRPGDGLRHDHRRARHDRQPGGRLPLRRPRPTDSGERMSTTTEPPVRRGRRCSTTRPRHRDAPDAAAPAPIGRRGTRRGRRRGRRRSRASPRARSSGGGSSGTAAPCSASVMLVLVALLSLSSMGIGPHPRAGGSTRTTSGSDDRRQRRRAHPAPAAWLGGRVRDRRPPVRPGRHRSRQLRAGDEGRPDLAAGHGRAGRRSRCVIGVTIGALAGYYRGKVDTVADARSPTWSSPCR